MSKNLNYEWKSEANPEGVLSKSYSNVQDDGPSLNSNSIAAVGQQEKNVGGK